VYYRREGPNICPFPVGRTLAKAYRNVFGKIRQQNTERKKMLIDEGIFLSAIISSITKKKVEDKKSSDSSNNNNNFEQKSQKGLYGTMPVAISIRLLQHC
jgi:hypothetical protein